VGQVTLPDVRFLADHHPPPDLSDPRPVVLVYADNGFHLGLDSSAVDLQRKKVEAYLNSLGIDTHEEGEAGTYVQALGVIIDGVKGVVQPTPERLTKVRNALVPLIRGRPTTGAELEHVLGHVLTIALLQGFTLSFLVHTYVFVRQSYQTRTRLWPSVRRELMHLRAVLPLCRAYLRRECSSSVMCTDACEEGMR
jgi:hypothetical protein